MINHRKAVKKAKSPEELAGPTSGAGSASPAWSGLSVQTGIAALDQLLKEDRLKRDKELDKIKWFHANTSRNLAEIKLKDVNHGSKKDGTFLVRENSASPGDFVLSLLYRKQSIHYKIIQYGSATYSIESGPKIQGLDKLIEHYQSSARGLPTKLTIPCKGRRPPPLSCAYGYSNILHRAISSGDETAAVQIITHSGCPNINSKNAAGSTAIHDACKLGMYKVVESLTQQGAYVGVTDVEGYTPLQRACLCNRADIVHLMVTKGRADPQDRQRDTGTVALHEACARGHFHCVQVLLSLNAPAWPRDDKSDTPYDLAKKNNHTECVQLIDSHIANPATTRRDDWFHDNIRNRQEAILLLTSKGQRDGMFIVRRSSRQPSCFVLTMIYELHPYNFEIQNVDDEVYVIDEGPLLPSLEHLIEYYSIRADGLPSKLAFALSKGGVIKNVSPREPFASLEAALKNCVVEDSKRLSTDNYIYTKPPSAKEPLKLDPACIKMLYEIGQGEYGSVLKGIWTCPTGEKVDVAVKTLNDQNLSSGRDSFMQEAKIMVKLDHPCIVRLIGVSMGNPIMLVQELVSMGSLLDYLLDYPERITVETDLYLWAAQVACGMMYLESQRFVHRDLAARNILLASKKQVKVGDFGLSRAIGSHSDYYRASEGGRWPVKWYAPECVNYGTFSSASDVWSYGVTLWEMLSFGDQPYEDKTGAQVLAYLEQGNRLPRPDKCPEKVYTIMKKCWAYLPSDRPTFKKLHHHFRTEPEYEQTRDLVLNDLGYSVSSTSV